MSFWWLLFYLVLFIIVLALVISCMFFVFSPFSCRKVSSNDEHNFLTHASSGKRIDLHVSPTNLPYLLKPSVQEAQIELLSHFARTLTEARIPFWAVNTTLLATVRHGQLMGWDDTISVALEDDHFREFCSLRFALQRGSIALLIAGKHSYMYCANNLARFPRVDITLMKRKDHEVSICTVDRKSVV